MKITEELKKLKENPCNEELKKTECCKMHKSCLMCVMDRAIEIAERESNG